MFKAFTIKNCKRNSKTNLKKRSYCKQNYTFSKHTHTHKKKTVYVDFFPLLYVVDPIQSNLRIRFLENEILSTQ